MNAKISCKLCKENLREHQAQQVVENKNKNNVLKQFKLFYVRDDAIIEQLLEYIEEQSS